MARSIAAKKKGKRIRMVVEFYHRGKTKIPSVNFWEYDAGEEIPQGPGFQAFSEEAHKYCRELVKRGELD